mgnify:CR=1 FL=1|jgi:dTDP-4-dehydrorhamnose reductase
MQNYKYLIIGSNGLLGSNIVKILKKKKLSYLTVARKKSNYNLDLKNFRKLKNFFKKSTFKIVINCAGIIDINYCEKHFDKALIINSFFVKFLSEMSRRFKFKLIQISTDHIYRGKKSKLNSEKSEIFAINNYAKTKIISERYLVGLKKYLIIRTNFTGKKKNTFIDWLIKSLKKKKTISLFDDMYTSTIDVKSCAKIIIDLSSINSKGIYNIGTRDSLSKKEFAIKIFKKLKKNIKFRSISCDIQTTPRGKNLGLNVKKIENKIGYKMPTSEKVATNLVQEYQ